MSRPSSARIPLVLGGLALLNAAACSGSSLADGGTLPGFDAGPQGCQVQFSGNYTDDQAVDGGSCGGLVAADGGYPDGGADWQLQLQAYSPVIRAATRVVVDFGPLPSAGTWTSSDLALWSAVADDESSRCQYAAGPAFSPAGTITLTLDSVQAEGPSRAGVHGALQVEQNVTHPPGASCGSNTSETVAFEF